MGTVFPVTTEWWLIEAGLLVFDLVAIVIVFLIFRTYVRGRRWMIRRRALLAEREERRRDPLFYWWRHLREYESTFARAISLERDVTAFKELYVRDTGKHSFNVEAAQ